MQMKLGSSIRTKALAERLGGGNKTEMKMAGPQKTFDIPAGDGSTVRADLFLPAAERPVGVVLMCHGFKGHRKWGFFPELAHRLARAGIAALPFDFSLNGWIAESGGEPGNGHRCPRPDLFRKNTIHREFEDLAAVVTHVSKTRLGNLLPEDLPIGVYGHSRGGFVAILHALENSDVRAICTWATTTNLDHFTERQKNRWRQDGFFAFIDSRDGSSLAIDVDYLDDLESNADRYRLVERIRLLRVPHLLVHGSMDLAVPPESSDALHRAETNLRKKRLLVLETGHTFGSTETAFEPSEAFELASEETVRWFHDHLR